MKAPEKVANLFAEYTAQIDTALSNSFKELPQLDAYGHLAYFMGFKNERLEDETTYAGKRFRSSLMLMLADWYGASDKTLNMAIALELFHNFTLIHDDVIDKDTTRRGRETVWKLFGIDHAINSGDIQMLLVSEMLAKGGSNVTQQFMLQQFRKVLEGQYLDAKLTESRLGDVGVDEDTYFQMVERKTADLIVAGTKSVGIIANLENKEQDALADYGRNLGLAYQVCDDTISIWSDSELTGKRNYGDIKEQKKTLPIIRAYSLLAKDMQEALSNLYSKSESLTDDECAEVIDLLDSVEVYNLMRKEIDMYANEAKNAAHALSCSNEQKEKLCTIVDTLLPKV